jgi:phosphoesterase RecJ-like protein
LVGFRNYCLELIDLFCFMPLKAAFLQSFMRNLEEFFPFLNHPFKAVVTMHQKPDGDALGSSLALGHFLGKLGHEVTVISPTNWPEFLNWIPGCSKVFDFESKKAASIEKIEAADFVFCLDFNALNRAKGLEPVLRSTKANLLLMDHHQEPETASFQYGWSNTGKGSTAEMVYDFIVGSGSGALIDKDIACCLYTGVMTDTGSFRFPSTTPSAHKMVARLMESDFDHSKVHEHIFDTFLENRLRFFGHVLLNRMDVNYELNTVLLAIPKSDLIRFDIKTGDTEGLVNYPLSMLGIKMAAIVIDRDEERKWSFRSKGDVDVNKFARKYFEGGGHKNAAGGKSSLSLEETVAFFQRILPELSPVLRNDEY